MKSLEESYKILRCFLSVLSFSTSSSTSFLFKLYRLIIFLCFLLLTGFRVLLVTIVVNSNSVPEGLKEKYNDIAFVLMIMLDFFMTLMVTVCFGFYQIFIKKCPLEIFKFLKRIDVILLNFADVRFNYWKSFLIISSGSAVLLILCSMMACFGTIDTKDLILGIYSSFSYFFTCQVFVVLFFIISLCNEIRLRLKCLQGILPMNQLKSEEILSILDLISGSMEIIGNFFAVEILIILGKFYLR